MNTTARTLTVTVFYVATEETTAHGYTPRFKGSVDILTARTEEDGTVTVEFTPERGETKRVPILSLTEYSNPWA